MKRNLLSIACATALLTQPITIGFAAPSQLEVFDHKEVASIKIKLETAKDDQLFDSQYILSSLKTKQGDPFSQITFDQDLKKLSEDYERVDPSLIVDNGQVFITIRLWEKPFIRNIKWEGNSKLATKKLQKELAIEPHTLFSQKEFNKAFNKVRELYVKKGYFEAQLSYKLVPIASSNEVDIVVQIQEGRSAHIGDIEFTGFSDEEKSDLLHMILTKKYSLFTSWLTGNGIYEDDKVEQDKLTIVNYLQNQGYADAHVSITTKDDPAQDKIVLCIKTVKGKLYHFGEVSFAGNHIYSLEDIEKQVTFKQGDKYSPEQLRQSAENIKDLYGEKGYIETNVQYDQILLQSGPIYNVQFHIDESIQYKIGIIRVLGNITTDKSVILNESLLVPGEVFDQRKLKATQQRLQNIGYFKSVNVYAIRNPDDVALGPEYRDVIIEVEETLTGSLSLFFGLSSTDSIFGGIDITENNFNHKGLLKFWKDGFSSLRGGGEFAQAKISVGKKQSNYQISWLTPYFNNTLWRVGFDLNYGISTVQSQDFKWKSIGGTIYASYPVTVYWTYGWSYRLRNSIIHVNNASSIEAQKQEKNSGIVTGINNYISYDSTDNPLKPHRGFRTTLEAEIAGVRRHDDTQKAFPFLKFGFLNSYYYPVWRKGTFKLKADGRFLETLGQGLPILLPTNERFYLGGEATVRGYKTAIIGPNFGQINGKGKLLPPGQQHNTSEDQRDPTGGASSILFSAEYMQNIIAPIDAFVFFDAGSISLNQFDVDTFRTSVGVGLRVNVGNRLPMTFGYGWALNSEQGSDKQPFFFSMGGQF
ncbi:MAG: outer membrane protein assembly factor BamA [Chlamydiales bacterium]|nr:outer membrane protein assembly factor BamA [Chlamydiales bacterium]